jgi:hypothetical protein
MERQFDSLSLPGPQSLPFGARNAPRKPFGAGDYRSGWYLLEDDSVELDDPRGWEPLIHEIGRIHFDNETVFSERICTFAAF